MSDQSSLTPFQSPQSEAPSPPLSQGHTPAQSPPASLLEFRSSSPSSPDLKPLILPGLVSPRSSLLIPSTSFFAMPSEEVTETKFGTTIQQFTTHLSSALSKHKLKVVLEDENYNAWYRPVYEVINVLDYDKYINVENHKDPNLTSEQHDKVKLIIATWILNQCDAKNADRARDTLSTRDDVTKKMVVDYNPYKLWKFFEDYHAGISEAKLSHIDNTLHSMTQAPTDRLRVHVEKFSAVLHDFYHYGGDLSSAQAARTLLRLLRKNDYDIVVKLIYQTVKPLTFKDVKKVLLDSEDDEDFTTPAMAQANHSVQSANPNASNVIQTRCTAEKCIGLNLANPHKESDCFKKPENAAKKEDWIAKQEAKRNKRRGGNSNNSAGTIQGLKSVKPPVASNSMMSFAINAADYGTFPISTITFAHEEELELIGSPEALSEEFAVASNNEFVDISASSISTVGNLWALYDTGASHHMFNSISLFLASSIKPVTDPSKRLRLAGGSASLAVACTGTVLLKDGNGDEFKLEQCLHVPELSRNLIAGGALIKKGVTTYIPDKNADDFALLSGSLVVFNGAFSGNLMLVSLDTVSLPSPQASPVTSDLYVLQHQRLGHLNPRYLDKMIKHGILDGLVNVPVSFDPCITCIQSKSTKLPFSGTCPRATTFLKNVHMDLSGINRVIGVGGESYFILFNDDYSAVRHLFGLRDKHKETIFQVIIIYIALVERQTGSKVKQFTMHRGSEFMNTVLGPFCEERGISLHFTASYTPEQNGVSERGMRTVIEKARCIMVQAGIPLQFWLEVCLVVIWLMNRCITAALPNDKTPFEMWYFRKPNIAHVRIIGCEAQCLIRKEDRTNKYNAVTSKGVLMGFCDDNFNYKIYDPVTKKFFITHNVTFIESSFPFKASETVSGVLDFDFNGPVPSVPDVPRVSPEEDSDDDDDVPDHVPTTHILAGENPVLDAPVSPPPPPPLRRSNINRPIVNYRGNVIEDDQDQPFPLSTFDVLDSTFQALSVTEVMTPRTFKQAMNSVEKDLWIVACEKEHKSLMDKNVWKLVDLPPGKHALRGFWLFKKKLRSDGTIAKYKARFVVMGNLQREGDYNETFSPTGKPSSLRLLIAMAAIHGWEIHQLDAVTAFLNGDLEEELYMFQPKGFVVKGKESKVCRLLKSLYGLKQSPKVWYDSVVAYLVSIGFKQSKLDPCIYIREDSVLGTFVAVYVHVDDMAVTGNDVGTFKAEVSSRWEMEDLGLAQTVVGIQITRLTHLSYSITQTALASSVLDRFNFNHLKPASTPLPGGFKLYQASDDEVQAFSLENVSYRSAVGSLMYLAQCTRPDLAYAVGVLSQHLEHPGRRHWDAVIHVFRYLTGTLNVGIVYSGEDSSTLAGQRSFSLPKPQAHCDSDWAGDRDSRRSTTGYIFKLAGGPLTWKSRLQPTVALSSTEAEYRAVTEAGQELLWLRNMMKLFGYEDKNPTVLGTDNMGAIHLTTKSTFHARTKHIEIQYHWIREVVNSGALVVQHVPTREMMADLLTKPLGKQQFHKLRLMLGMQFVTQ